jgi:hypothetical protein
MNRKVLIALIGIIIATGAALAAVPLRPTLPFYYIIGKVTSTDASALPNRPVVFYKDNNVDDRVETMTDQYGNYQLNAYELRYYKEKPITLDGVATYEIAAARTAGFNYGTVEVITLTTEAGYVRKDLVAVEGGGPFIIIEGEPPAGTVPLYISRNGADILITWEAQYLTPQIYALYGDGTGKYTNSYASGWEKVAEGATVASGYTTVNNSLTHQNQVGQGSPEAYYKGIVAGIDIAQAAATFEAAWAVGKVNVELKKATSQTDPGKNYISIPFNRPSNTINNVMLVDQFDDGTKVYSQLQGQHYNFDIAKVKNTAWVSGFSDTTLVGDTFMIVPEKGYMVEVPNDKTVTVMGNVLRGTEGRSRLMDANDYTYIGNFYAFKFQLWDADANDRLKLTGAAVPNDGDRIYYQLKPGTLYNFNIAEYRAGAWKSGFNTSALSDITLRPPYGYMYKRVGDGFTWLR